MKLKTVTINRDGVAVRINASDYIPQIHTLWGEEKGDEKDPLIAALKERGIERDKRTGINTLRKLLEGSE